jgi:F0F1-type ATP synthase membrane subunit b/b'
MKMILVLITIQNAMAAGDGHHADASSLLYPAINFIIFVSLLGWFLFPVLKKTFSEKHQKIKSASEQAQNKLEEAQKKLATAEKKLQGLAAELEKIKKEAQSDFVQFTKNMEKEAVEREEKLSIDAKSKVENERATLYYHLSNEIVNKVVSTAKEEVKGNAGVKKEINQRLTQGISV